MNRNENFSVFNPRSDYHSWREWQDERNTPEAIAKANREFAEESAAEERYLEAEHLNTALDWL